MTDTPSTPKTSTSSAMVSAASAKPSDGTGVRIEDTREKTIAFEPRPVAQISQSRGPLATARSPQGSTIANRPVADTDIVTIGGIEISVAQAIQFGFLTKGPDGVTDVSPEAAAAALDDGQAAEKERAFAEDQADLEEFGVAADPESVEVLSTITKAVESVGGNPVSSLAEWSNDMSKLPTAIQMAVEREGADPTDVLQAMRETHDRLTASVEKTMVRHGLPEAEVAGFWQWVNANRRGDLVNAAMQLPFTGDARPYLKLMTDYQNHIRYRDYIDPEHQSRINVRGVGPVAKSVADRIGLTKKR